MRVIPLWTRLDRVVSLRSEGGGCLEPSCLSPGMRAVVHILRGRGRGKASSDVLAAIQKCGLVVEGTMLALTFQMSPLEKTETKPPGARGLEQRLGPGGWTVQKAGLCFYWSCSESSLAGASENPVC